MSQEQLDEIQTVLKKYYQANAMAGGWLSEACKLHDRILILRRQICGDREYSHHQWEIDVKGNDMVAPRSRAFCIRCDEVKFL